MANLVPIKGGRAAAPASNCTDLMLCPERPHREEVIHKLLAVGEIGAVVAPAGEGKSAVVQLLATCISEGRPFLGREVMRGPSIYVAAERGNGSVRRLLAIKQRAKRRSTLRRLVPIWPIRTMSKSSQRISPWSVKVSGLARC